MTNTIKLLLCGISSILLSCNTNTSKMEPSKAPQKLKGSFVVQLQIDSNNILPFNLNISDEVFIVNGQEKIECKNYNLTDTTFNIDLPVFDGYLEGTLEGKEWKGLWHNLSKGEAYIIPFTLTKSSTKFSVNHPATVDLQNKWKIIFSPKTEDAYPAIGVFKTMEGKVEGTFLTETGDYRYLSGIWHKNKTGKNELLLSCFDGAHAFLFKALLENDSLRGSFWSGSHWQEPFTGVIDHDFKLASADTLTYLKDGYEDVTFSFPNTEGVTITSNILAGKVSIIQILGSWCPNCMDETRYLVDIQTKYPQVQIVGLCFEKSTVFEQAVKPVSKMMKDLNVNYPMLIAGSYKKTSAVEKLPMLNHIMSYPTTILINKKGQVEYIHTGFNGPGTGKLFNDFNLNFTNKLNKLLAQE